MHAIVGSLASFCHMAVASYLFVYNKESHQAIQPDVMCVTMVPVGATGVCLEPENAAVMMAM